MPTVTDAEIDATLEPYGEWVESADYGLVWRPYATVVGVDFTPYESGGQWVYTDFGWTFTSEWDWGWLPFHYGRWGFSASFGWYWAPGRVWGPGWVSWGVGHGYVGWCPLGWRDKPVYAWGGWRGGGQGLGRRAVREGSRSPHAPAASRTNSAQRTAPNSRSSSPASDRS